MAFNLFGGKRRITKGFFANSLGNKQTRGIYTFQIDVENGELISSAEILTELKDEDLAKWAKAHKSAFIPLTQEVQLKTKEVLEKYPAIIMMRSSRNSNGDPFLIATAVLYDGIVVTDEGTKANGIPSVCQGLGIEYINLSTYLDKILE